MFKPIGKVKKGQEGNLCIFLPLPTYYTLGEYLTFLPSLDSARLLVSLNVMRGKKVVDMQIMTVACATFSGKDMFAGEEEKLVNA